MAVSVRDRKSLMTLVEQAQVAYLLTRYPKKQVLDDPADVKRLSDALEGMRGAARALPASLKEAHGMIQWDELADRPDTPDLAWRRAKRIAPTALRELVPLLKDMPEAAFFLRPEAPKREDSKRQNTTKKRAARKRA